MADVSNGLPPFRSQTSAVDVPMPVTSQLLSALKSRVQSKLHCGMVARAKDSTVYLPSNYLQPPVSSLLRSSIIACIVFPLFSCLGKWNAAHRLSGLNRTSPPSWSVSSHRIVL